MTRHSNPTLPDIRLEDVTQLQYIWSEFGPGARYFIRGEQGDCLVIEIRASQDLMKSIPYSTELSLNVSFVLVASQPVDDTIDESLMQRQTHSSAGEDDEDRITLVSSVPPPPSARPRPNSFSAVRYSQRPSSQPPLEERIDVNFVNLRIVPQSAFGRIMLIRPVIRLRVTPYWAWHLEIKVPKFDLTRRIPPSATPLIPRAP